MFISHQVTQKLLYTLITGKTTSFLTALPGWSGLAAALGSLLAPLCFRQSSLPLPVFISAESLFGSLLFFF